MAAKIRIGTCGFSFKDWKGVVYPADIKDNEILPYYNHALDFDTVEIDVSYYTLMPVKVVESWLNKTADNFTFAVKLHKDLTLNEHGKDEDPLWKNNDETFKKFLFSFETMVSTKRLECFLAQFGPLFWKSEKHKEYLLKMKTFFGERPLVIEFRHKSWLAPEEAKNDTLRFLAQNGLGYAVVDEPRLRSLAPFVPATTLKNVSYVRLHGRNKAWFEADRDKRYDYFYSDDELKSLVPAVLMLSKETPTTVVYFNNCHAGAALKNAQRMKELIIVSST